MKLQEQIITKNSKHYYGFVGLPNHWTDDYDNTYSDKFFEDKEYNDYYFDNFLDMDKTFGYENSLFGTKGLPVGHRKRSSKSFDIYNEKFGPMIVRLVKDKEKLQEQISRMKSIMGINEKIEVDDDSYVTMNIKNFPNYKKQVSVLLKDKLNNSNSDFVTFKNSVIVGYDQNGTPILSDDLNIDNRYLNYMVSMGSKKFNSLLYSIFSDFYGTEVKSNETKSEVINCDPSNFEILGPITAQDEKSLINYWVSQKGGKVYIIKLPEECSKQLDVNERKVYVTVEPKENRVHFPKGVPEKLRGKKLGTLIYLAMIKKLGYITSSMGNSPEIKMVYQDILTNPKYQEDVMSLLLQKQVIIFDRNTNLDIKKIFNEFVSGKFTEKKSVRISPALQEILGDDYTNWYNSLEESSEQLIQNKIEKYKDLEPKGGDTVVDTTTNKIYSFNGEWEDKGKKQILLLSDKYETLLLPAEEKKRFKVIHRQFN